MDGQQFFQPSGSRFRSSVTCKRCHVPCAPLISTAVPLHSTAFTTRWLWSIWLDPRPSRSLQIHSHGRAWKNRGADAGPARPIHRFFYRKWGFQRCPSTSDRFWCSSAHGPWRGCFETHLGMWSPVIVVADHPGPCCALARLPSPEGIGCTDCITQIHGNEVKVCGDDCVCVCAWPFQAQTEFQTVSQCDNKNAAGLCDNQQNWCKQEPGQEISMIFHVCMLLVRGVCPPPAHALFYG